MCTETAIWYYIILILLLILRKQFTPLEGLHEPFHHHPAASWGWLTMQIIQNKCLFPLKLSVTVHLQDMYTTSKRLWLLQGKKVVKMCHKSWEIQENCDLGGETRRRQWKTGVNYASMLFPSRFKLVRKIVCNYNLSSSLCALEETHGSCPFPQRKHSWSVCAGVCFTWVKR